MMVGDGWRWLEMVRGEVHIVGKVKVEIAHSL